MKAEQMTRRQWLERVPMPAMAAAAMTGALGVRGAAAQTATGGGDLGVRTYSIRDFGAKGDGVTLDTAALQAAVDACTRDGGGTVVVPAGTFVIGTVELKSNV